MPRLGLNTILKQMVLPSCGINELKVITEVCVVCVCVCVKLYGYENIILQVKRIDILT